MPSGGPTVNPRACVESLPGAEPFPEPLARRLADAVAARGPGYAPRTHHLDASGRPRFTNRLVLERSPYLLQHAHNPVNWCPWGDEAFDEARRTRTAGLPLRRLLHLPLVPRDGARVVRGRGDRARPQRALRRHQGRPRGAAGRRRDLHDRGPAPHRRRRLADERVAHAGPRAVLRRHLLPAARRRPRGARGFLSILARHRGGVRARPGPRRAPRPAPSSRAVRDRPRAARRAGLRPARAGGRSRRRWRRYAPRLRSESHGGVRRRAEVPVEPPGAAPAAPPPPRRGDAESLQMATLTLEQMAAGGIHDQLGGGFHRYSTDARVARAALREDALRQRAPRASPTPRRGRSPGGATSRRVARQTLDYLVARDDLARRAGSTRPPTPTPRARRGASSSGTSAEIREVLGADADRLRPRSTA